MLGINFPGARIALLRLIVAANIKWRQIFADILKTTQEEPLLLHCIDIHYTHGSPGQQENVAKMIFVQFLTLLSPNLTRDVPLYRYR